MCGCVEHEGASGRTGSKPHSAVWWCLLSQIPAPICTDGTLSLWLVLSCDSHKRSREELRMFYAHAQVDLSWPTWLVMREGECLLREICSQLSIWACMAVSADLFGEFSGLFLLSPSADGVWGDKNTKTRWRKVGQIWGVCFSGKLDTGCGSRTYAFIHMRDLVDLSSQNSVTNDQWIKLLLTSCTLHWVPLNMFVCGVYECVL